MDQVVAVRGRRRRRGSGAAAAAAAGSVSGGRSGRQRPVVVRLPVVRFSLLQRCRGRGICARRRLAADGRLSLVFALEQQFVVCGKTNVHVTYVVTRARIL